MEFDVAVGDNDNAVRQKSKIAWASKNDPLKADKLHGKLLFTNNDSRIGNSAMLRINRCLSPDIDWSKIGKTNINNLVFGSINDDADFSAHFKGFWIADYLILKFEINDSKENKFKKDKLMKDDNFVDKRWIEDELGKKVWKMSLLHSKYGGGAPKNQYCDAIIPLEPGKYVIRYISYESHSFEKWDADRPIYSFWGINVKDKSSWKYVKMIH